MTELQQQILIRMGEEGYGRYWTWAGWIGGYGVDASASEKRGTHAALAPLVRMGLVMKRTLRRGADTQWFDQVHQNHQCTQYKLSETGYQVSNQLTQQARQNYQQQREGSPQGEEF